jgi:hypothetical protein
MLLTFVKFFTEVVTDFMFLPALVPLAKQKRHFPMAVALAQLLATLMYNLSDALASKLFIERIQWHFMSDVLTLTYFLHVLVHLEQADEETSAILRYLGFFLAWIFKMRDAWDSKVWEAGLVVLYVLGLVRAHVMHPERRRRLAAERASRGIGSATLGFVFFALSQALPDPYKLLIGAAHVCAGFALFELWSCFPAAAHEKRPSAAAFV